MRSRLLLPLLALCALLCLPSTLDAQRSGSNSTKNKKKKKVVPAVQGKTAPDFTVTLMNTKGKKKVTLSKLYKTKPVVIVFGSYT